MLGNLKEKAKSKATDAIANVADPSELVLGVLRKAPVPMKIADLAESTGLDKTIVDKALKTLKKDGRITSPERCCYTVV